MRISDWSSDVCSSDLFGSRGMSYQIATFADLDEARNAYEEGRCDAWSNERGTIAARSQALKNKDEHMLLPETLPKEPIGPLVRMNDPEWAHDVRWKQIARASCRDRWCPYV